jgi:hypothetical protein
MAGQRNDTPESIVSQRGQLQSLTSIYDFVKIFLGISGYVAFTYGIVAKSLAILLRMPYHYVIDH